MEKSQNPDAGMQMHSNPVPPGYSYPVTAPLQPGAMAAGPMYPQMGYMPPPSQSNQQSSQQSTTAVVINQPSAAAAAAQQPTQSGPRDWYSHYCSCCDDMSSCLLGTCCPCVLAMQVPMDMGEHCCVCCCVPGWLIVMRTKLRTENNIKGSVMGDCCMSYWCGACVLCQMKRELKYLRYQSGIRM